MAGEDLRAKEEVAIVHRTFEHVLGVPVSQQRQDHGKRLAIVMRLAGWQAGRTRLINNGVQVRCQWREVPPAAPSPEEGSVWTAKLQPPFLSDGWAGGGDIWCHPNNGKAIGVQRAGNGWWFIFSAQGLLGEAGVARQFNWPILTQRRQVPPGLDSIPVGSIELPRATLLF
jgi:hypothetical protein